MRSKKLVPLAVIFACLGAVAGLITVRIFHVQKPTAGLKIETTPPSLVFINNVQVGRTPLDQMFNPGETTIKLIPESTSLDLSAYQTKVQLTDKVYTVIRRDFSFPESQSSGETITLIPQSGKTASLSVITFDPDAASVMIDNEPQGFSPLAIDNITPSDHQIEISAPGYQTRVISAKAISGYQLSVNAKLAAKNQVIPSIPSVLISETPAATPSASVTPSTPTTPSPSLKATPSITKPYVIISSTPTGFLRVRTSPSKTADEVGQVKPGENYPLMGSVSGWYQIKIALPATSSGWISADYAQAFK